MVKFKKNIAKILNKYHLLYKLLYYIYNIIISMRNKDLFYRRMKLYNEGMIMGMKKYIRGKNNKMYVGKGAKLKGTFIRVCGCNNIIRFGENVHVGPGCSFWMEGNNIEIIIGDKTSFTRNVHVNAQENNSKIIIGEDCMFSNSIIVRTSDSHPIYDKLTNKRLNTAASIYIGNHVWIASGSTIMKKSKIGDGSIIGSNTLINKEIPENSLAVGMPAKVVKENIYWTREALF